MEITKLVEQINDLNQEIICEYIDGSLVFSQKNPNENFEIQIKNIKIPSGFSKISDDKLLSLHGFYRILIKKP